MLERLTRDPMADAWHGAVRILSLTAPAGRGRYQTCRMQLALEATGLAPENLDTEVVLDRRFWPDVGVVLPARISRSLPRQVEVAWDTLAP